MAGVPSLDVKVMRKSAGEATGLLRALSNEDRLLILCQLSRGEHSVGELEALLDIHQPTLSQQLGVLRSQHLVKTRRHGKQIRYCIHDRRAIALLKALYTLYCGATK